MKNTLKVAFLLSILTMLFILIGRTLGGPTGMVIAFALAIAMNFGSYWFSDKIVLRMYGATPLTPQEAPEIFEMTGRLCQRAGLPMPRLYMTPGDQPNAFATGRNPSNAAVAVTEGLLRVLNRNEVEGVIAHELAHVKHRDTLTMTIAAALAGAVMMLVDMAQWAMIFGGFGRGNDEEEGSGAGGLLGGIVLMIAAPVAAMLIQSAISRAREFEADRAGAEMAGSPGGLINALQKLEMASARIPMEQGSPSTAHMFIVNPFKGLGGVANLFRTHPPTEQRIEKLRALA